MTTNRKKRLHLPWNRLHKYMLLYACLLAATLAGALVSHRYLGSHHSAGAYQTAGLFTCFAVLCTYVFFAGNCRMPRQILVLVHRRSSEQRLRSSGICPIHGRRAIEHRARRVFIDFPDLEGGADYCTACGEFVDRGAGQGYYHNRARPV